MKTKTQSPWARLDAMMKTDPEPTGPEWFTIGQFAARYDLSHAGAAVRLNKMERTKKVVRWKGRVAGSCGVKCKYRLK